MKIVRRSVYEIHLTSEEAFDLEAVLNWAVNSTAFILPLSLADLYRKLDRRADWLNQ